MSYNPFNKTIGDLALDDINTLIINEVAEGYFIGYKKDFPENNNIGQSIASFANTYGGWYFVGIETNEHNIAKNVCGFDLEKISKPVDKIREIIKTHIDPVPAFFTQIIFVDETKAVLIVYIPGEQETPFVSKKVVFIDE